MKNISEIRRHYEQLFAKKFCNVDNVSCCPKGECTCRIAAEVKAYLMAILPEGYSHYTIKDFTGCSQTCEELLDKNVALEAKMKIAEYCWNIKDKNSLKQLENTSNLDDLSVMDQRLRIGSNVIIHGGISRKIIDENGVQIKESQKGRTLAASIIMKEAIKRRSHRENLGQTYDWVPYHKLMELLINKKEIEYADYRYCDWLVIDDITIKQSDNAQSFYASHLDPFLQDRLDSKLPTIFVCKFDIMEQDVEASFGIVMGKLVNSPTTFKIKLV